MAKKTTITAGMSREAAPGPNKVEINLGGQRVEVDLSKFEELLESGRPVGGGPFTVDRRGKVRVTKLDRFEDSIVEELRPRIRKQLGALAAADIDPSSLGAPEDLAESMAAVLPASHPFDDIVGPFYDTAGLRKWLGLTRQGINHRAKSHQLLACSLEDGTFVYPTWQFDKNGAVIPGVHEALSMLSTGTDDNWQKALWFNTPSAQLGNRSPKDWLLKGRPLSPVIELAARTAARWGR